MLEPGVTGWPEGIDFSMAPFGYVVQVKKTLHTETGVTYTCKCGLDVSVDPRDMTIQSVAVLMRQHVDQAH